MTFSYILDKTKYIQAEIRLIQVDLSHYLIEDDVFFPVYHCFLTKGPNPKYGHFPLAL